MSTNGHSLIKGFKRLIATDGLGHAYLLFGESEEARHELGLSILKLLENHVDFQSDFLQDGLILEKDLTGSIGIDIIRSAINFLWQRPIASSRRAVFIENVDCLTSQAENALLKTIEEPPAHGLVIGSALSSESLALTLVSRFQKIFVPTPITFEEISSQEAQKFIQGSVSTRKFMIAEVLAVESHSVLLGFVRALLVECRKDPLKNFELMRRLTDRWSKISQFNVNKKLHLETLLM